MIIELQKEEVLACILALERKKSLEYIGKWAKSARDKLDKSLNQNTP